MNTVCTLILLPCLKIRTTSLYEDSYSLSTPTLSPQEMSAFLLIIFYGMSSESQRISVFPSAR